MASYDLYPVKGYVSDDLDRFKISHKEFVKGVQAISAVDGLHSVNYTLDLIFEKTLSLSLLIRDKTHFDGFILTQLLRSDYDHYTLNIFGCYIHPDAYKFNYRSMEEYFDVLDRITRGNSGVNEITFYSSRPGFERRMKNMGFRPRLVEYVKAIQHG